ncbi:MAG TPA: YicC family protein [Gammaproteobacteria bacterium]|nr:YicC family protein [Gammaproteobacteria bacterium]
MLSSMTGFARVEKTSPAGSMVLELRTVNHRYLDISFRMPEELRAFEGQLREKLQHQLSRGKVECNLRFSPVLAGGEIIVDEAAVEALLAAVQKVESIMSNAARMPALDILRWPGIIQENALDKNEVNRLLLDTVDKGLKALLEMRAQEGRRMGVLLHQRLDQIEEITEKVRKRRPEVIVAIREKMQARLQMLDVDADPGRLEQEMAIIAQKLDVDEELDRLDSHVKATREVLERSEPVGRRLDFLMQEFNREANTLSSKSADSETTQAAVEMKVMIEQMREQVQNIE